MKEIKIQIKQLIAKNIGKAFQVLDKKVNSNSNAYDDLVILQSRLNKLKRGEVQGVLSNEEININFNKLTKAAIDYLNDLKAEDFISVVSEKKKIVKRKSIFSFPQIIDSLPQKAGRVNRKIKRIEDLFKTNIRNTPNSSFEKLEDTENSMGESVFRFRKKLKKLEFELFDTIEVNLIGGRTRNIFFINRNPNELNPEKLKRLINNFYEFMGEDDYGKKEFSASDLEDYYSKDYYLLFGRNWREFPKYENPIVLTRDITYISLGVWGIEI